MAYKKKKKKCTDYEMFGMELKLKSKGKYTAKN